MKLAAIKVLVEYAASRVGSEPIESQVVIYQALGELMPTSKARRDAKEISQTLSRAAALQLDFNKTLFDIEQDGNGKGDGDGKH